MQYKKGQRVQYIDKYDRLETASIVKVEDSRIYVKEFGISRVDSINESQILRKLTPLWLYRALVITGGLMLLSLFIYMMSNVEPVEYSKPTAYEVCVKQVNYIYDNINDTVGATYATQDTPTSNIQKLINQCMELNK